MPVKKREEFTHPELERYVFYRHQYSVPHPGPFDEWGLRFSTNHLNWVKCTIILFPLEDMAKYADRVTWRALHDKDPLFYQQLYEFTPTEAEFETMKATSIGNLALVASICSDPDVRKRAREILDGIYEWHMAVIAKQNT